MDTDDHWKLQKEHTFTVVELIRWICIVCLLYVAVAEGIYQEFETKRSDLKKKITFLVVSTFSVLGRIALVQTVPFERRIPVLAGYPKIRMTSIPWIHESTVFAARTIALELWKVTMLYSFSPRCISVPKVTLRSPLSPPFPPIVRLQVSLLPESSDIFIRRPIHHKLRDETFACT